MSSNKEMILEEFTFDLPNGCTFVIIGDTKNRIRFIENIFYYEKHKRPVSRSFICSEAGYERICEFTHPLFVNYSYRTSDELEYIKRQKTYAMEKNHHWLQVPIQSINVIDGLNDSAFARSNVARALFTISGHLEHIFVFGTKDLLDFPIYIRKSVHFVVLFEEENVAKRKTLYQEWVGGLVKNFGIFCDLMDSISGTNQCLIFMKRRKHESIFWYEPALFSDWKFGCEEYRKWGDERCQEEYNENSTKNKWALIKEVLNRNLCGDLTYYLLECFVIGLCWKDL